MLLYFFRSINLLFNRIPHLESRNLIRQDKYGNRIIILQFFVYFTFIFTKVSINMRVNIINFPAGTPLLIGEKWPVCNPRL